MQLYLLYLQIIPTFVPIKSNPIINKTSTAVMKKKTILFASCLLGVFAFSSCEKNLYDESKQPEKEIQDKRPGYTRRLSMERFSNSQSENCQSIPHYGFCIFG